MYEDYNTMTFERVGRILRITLNRPDHLNAVTREMHHEVARVFREVKLDPETDVITLTGAGKGFCAGADFNEPIPDQASRDNMFIEAREILVNILEVDKPIITGVNGAATGLGSTLALMGDIVIASEKARIGDTHVKLGLAAGDGGCLIFPLLVGVNKAKELLMTGDILDAQEALRIGLVNRVVTHDQLDQALIETAQKLASGHLMAINFTKKAVNLYLKWMLNLSGDAALNLEHMCVDRMITQLEKL
jgi:enoyl-CoA hydratase